MLGHIALAGAFKAPGLVIDEGEAEKLSAALDALLAHYISVDVDAKTRDWINLAMVAGGVYGPRIYVALNRQSETKTPEAPKPTELKPTMNGMQRVHIPGVGDAEVPMAS